MFSDLTKKIKNKTAKLGIVGFGYVGLPLAIEFLRAGFDVTGVDLSEEKVKKIYNGDSYIGDVSSDEIAHYVKNKQLHATTDFATLKEVDVISICVPTPLRKTKDPDVSYIVNAIDEIKKNFHDGILILLESTTYPGTTRELMLPVLEEGGKKVGEDFWLGFSPERVDPGNKSFTTRNVPKVVGGITSKCTEIATELYKAALDTVIPVSAPEVAEMVKLLENTFRSVNIGLVNEVALMCDKMSIDVWEVIDAAASKPFGFMPFYPGPGLGGHCIPIDPFYLSWKARSHGFESRFIELAGDVNSRMPQHVVNKATNLLNEDKKCVNGAKILLVGVAYKQDISDVRESPALDIIDILHTKGAQICYCDEYIPDVMTSKGLIKSLPFSAKLINSVDIAIILTAHSNVDYSMLVNECKVILDTRNCLKAFSEEHIHKL